MKLDNFLHDDIILILPNKIMNKIINYISSLDKIYNIKYSTFNDINKNLFFNYDEKTIYYLMEREKVNYDNSLILLDNLYYLELKNKNSNIIIYLNKIYNYLNENNLLEYNLFYKKYILNKKIIVYGFDILNKYQLYIIDCLRRLTEVEIINEENNNYFHDVLEFNDINEEIEYITNDIISKNLDLNKVYIANVNDDYLSTLLKVFEFYKIPHNISKDNNLYNIKIGKDLLDNLDNVNNYLNNIDNENIKKIIITILNKYSWAENYISVKNMLISEFKKSIIPNDKFDNAINEINLFDNIINEDDHIYIIGFNQDYIPYLYEDTDLIYDEIKANELENTSEKNQLEISRWSRVIHKVKNLTITYSKNGINKIFNQSALIDDLKLKVVETKYDYSLYSNISNKYNLGMLLDEYYKYNILNNNLSVLLSKYPNSEYLTYNNYFSGLINFKGQKLNLSYSKVNSFYKCQFKYYLKFILKINIYQQEFDSYLGSLCHYILKNIFSNDFNLEKRYNEFVENNYFEHTVSQKFYLKKIMQELKKAINFIIEHHNISKYKDIECEKEINVKFDENTDFSGIIDKIMSYQNNIAIIDYKTGTNDIDLSLADQGLNLQLPIYLYLIKAINRNSNITGIYLEHILCPKFNYDENKTLASQEFNYFKLVGYSTSDEEQLSIFEPTYEKSKYIKAMSKTATGFNYYSKILSPNQFLNLEKIVEKKIRECIKKINEADFKINPKIVDNTNVSCNYCQYNSICFVNENNLSIIKPDKELSFLGGENYE